MNKKKTLENLLLWFGICFGLIFWGVDVFVDAVLFKHQDIMVQILHPEPVEIWMRTTVMLFIVLFGILGKYSLSKMRIAEDELRRSNEFAQTVLNSMNDAITIIDTRDYSVVGANRVFLEKAGKKEREVIGRKCFELSHNTSIPCGDNSQLCPLRDTVISGKECIVEHEHIRSDGTKISEEISVSPIFDEEGNISRVVHIDRDITQRKNAEEVLRESEARYRAIFENTGAITVIVNERMVVLMCNAEFEKVLGYNKQEVEGQMLWSAFISPEDLEKIMECCRYRHENPDAGTERYDVRILTKSHDLLHMSMTVAAISGTANHVLSLLDITSRIQAEEAVKESEAELAKAQQIAQVGSWVWDIRTSALMWSDEAYRLMGISPRSVIPTYDFFLSHLHPEDRDYVNRAINESLYNRKPYQIEFRAVLPGGNVRHVEAQGEVTYDANGNPLRMRGTFHDITLKKETESALRKSEEKFYKAFQTSPDWIVITRVSDGLYLEVNNAFLKLTGYSWDEVIGHTSLDLGIWEDPAQRVEMLKVLAEHGRVRNFPVWFCDKNGGRHRMRWSAEVMEYQGEACLIAVAREETATVVAGSDEG